MLEFLSEKNLTVQQILWSIRSLQQTTSNDHPVRFNKLHLEILLAQSLKISRTLLYAYPERVLTESEKTNFQNLAIRYLQDEPLAYITGYAEFWSLELIVTRDTLIPRPETELLVELVLEKAQGDRVADLGTGTGAIALALATERKNWQVIATDVNENALAVARKNATRLNISNIHFYLGSWCVALPELKFNAIVSNPPYVDVNDPALDSLILNYEPRLAIIAEDEGLTHIKEIISVAKNFLKPQGFLMLEHGYLQAEKVQSLLAKMGYYNIETYKDFLGKERATIGQWR